MASSSGKLYGIDIPAYNANDPSTVVQVLPAVQNRSRWRIINVGLAQAHYGFDATTLKPAYGWPLETAPTLGGQGGGDDADQAPLSAVFVVSQSGTRIVVQDYS